MALQYNGLSITDVNYNGININVINLNGSVAWCKEFTLTINKGTNVSSVTVKRTATQQPGATTGILSSGAILYYGDTLSIYGMAATGYDIVLVPNGIITVTGNILVKATAHSSSCGNPCSNSIAGACIDCSALTSDCGTNCTSSASSCLTCSTSQSSCNVRCTTSAQNRCNVKCTTSVASACADCSALNSAGDPTYPEQPGIESINADLLAWAKQQNKDMSEFINTLKESND